MLGLFEEQVRKQKMNRGDLRVRGQFQQGLRLLGGVLMVPNQILKDVADQFLGKLA